MYLASWDKIVDRDVGAAANVALAVRACIAAMTICSHRPTTVKQFSAVQEQLIRYRQSDPPDNPNILSFFRPAV